MEFNSIEAITKGGFKGFVSIKDLNKDSSVIPNNKGVYLVLYLNKRAPEYLPKGTGGFFKRKNPNVGISKLTDKWVKDTVVVYIGKAGSEKGSATLQSRLKQYLQFGQGKDIGHYGGRYLWQIKNSQNLVICWKPIKTGNPATIESDLIRQFIKQYEKFPFANLRG